MAGASSTRPSRVQFIADGSLDIYIGHENPGGPTVNLAARGEHTATNGHIFTTKTIRDMLIGSSCGFDDAGFHTLKGFEEEW